MDEAAAREMADRLVEVGFFERRGTDSTQRIGLRSYIGLPSNLIQESADGVAPVPGEEDS